MLSNACHKSTVRKKRLMDVRAIFAGLAFALIWSSAFTSARIIVADAPPMLALSLRNYTMHYCRYFTYYCYNDDERSVFWWEPSDDSGVADACGFRAPGGSWVFV